MGLQNQTPLVANDKFNNTVVKYDYNGQPVVLTPDIVRSYLVNGDGTVTDQEIVMFLNLCRFQHLNPFLKEAYLIKYSSNSSATIVTGKEEAKRIIEGAE